MKTSLVALISILLAGCGIAPQHPSPPRGVILEQRTITETLTARFSELAFYALGQIGAPYRYGGSSPAMGFDCSGLVQYVYSRGAGISLPRNTQAMSAVGSIVPADMLEPGDLVFFDTLRKPFSHVGIYLGDQRFIHAPTTGGAVQLADLRQRYWSSRYNGARRIEP